MSCIAVADEQPVLRLEGGGVSCFAIPLGQAKLTDDALTPPPATAPPESAHVEAVALAQDNAELAAELAEEEAELADKEAQT